MRPSLFLTAAVMASSCVLAHGRDSLGKESRPLALFDAIEASGGREVVVHPG